MELPPRNASYPTFIKCSSCGQDISMNALPEHVCGQVTGMPLYAEPRPMAPYSPSIINPQPILGKPPRPFVPRIDPFAPTRNAQFGEMTPSSSQDSFAASPVSAGSGRRSPFRVQSRKGSAPTSRRPPSPELLSQDCAFPPFPTSAKSKSKESSRSDSRRERTRTPDGSNSIRSFERDAKRSASVGASRARIRQGTMDSSRPSTAASSRRPSISSTTEGRKESYDIVPPIPPLQQTLSNLSTTSEPGHAQGSPAGTWPLPVDAKATTDEPTLPSLPNPDFVQHSDPTEFASEDTSVPRELIPPPPQPNFPPRMDSQSSFAPSELQDQAKEPAYKAKRPPPIVSPMPYHTEGQIPTLKSRSPTVPAPTTPGSAIGRTLTGLFGRRRGQSTSAKRTQPQIPDVNSPRFKALAPEPEAFTPPYNFQQHELDSSQSDDNISPQFKFESEPGSRMGEGEEEVDGTTLPDGTLQAHPNHPADEHMAGISKELDKPTATIVEQPTVTVTEQSAELRRASMDSASSYGSIGFSHSSASSHSTNPSEVYAKPPSNIGEPGPYEIEIIPHSLALQIPETIPDSPTDPFYQHGKLTPVPEIEHPPESHNDEAPRGTPTIPAEAAGFDFPQPPISERLRRPSTPGASRGVCRGCSKMILSGQKSVSSKDGRLTGRYHKECFVCRTCKSPFATADFYVHDDHPYCAHHYHVANNTLCASCGKGIEGEYMETSSLSGKSSKKFHQHCLKCATCKISLHNDYFELGGRVYCERDAFKMAHAGPRSPYDTAPSRPSPLNREYISSSEPGKALNAGRFPERRTTKLMMTSY